MNYKGNIGSKETLFIKSDGFELKTEGEEKGVFSGYGSTFGGEPDSYGDIIVRGAFSKSLSSGGRNGNGIAMLWGHDPQRPIGKWIEIEENNKGLKVKGKLSLGSRDGGDMFELMKDGAVQGLSIGFQTVDYDFNDKTGVRHIKETNLWEISPVVFPANTRATITGVKNAIESAKTPRELEAALRDSGVSKSDALYLVSKLKNIVFERVKNDNNQLQKVLNELKNTNSNLSKILKGE